MSSNNPSVTASDIITDTENRLGTPGISTDVYLPWVSYAYAKTYAALYKSGRTAREKLFGNYLAVTLTNGTAEYALSTILPRFASMIKAEILFGGTGDQRQTLTQLQSIAHWQNQGNVSTSYRSKTTPLFYLLEDTIGIIPTPPASDTDNAILYAWYVKRPYQITAGTDVIDLPYRFIYPLVNYVTAKAIETENEDYQQSGAIELKFEKELEQISATASDEFNENDGLAVEVSSSSYIYENPFS